MEITKTLQGTIPVGPKGKKISYCIRYTGPPLYKIIKTKDNGNIEDNGNILKCGEILRTLKNNNLNEELEECKKLIYTNGNPEGILSKNIKVYRV